MAAANAPISPTCLMTGAKSEAAQRGDFPRGNQRKAVSMSNYDHLKRIADQAEANNQKAFSGPAYNAAPAQTKNLMDALANRKTN
jgi:hypothetical protein